MIAVGSVLPALLIFLTGLNTQHAGRAVTFLLISQNSMFIFNILMAPPLFSLFAGFIVARENQDQTINQLFMYPQSRVLFFIGKWLILLLLFTLTVLFLFLLIVLMGVYFHSPVTESQLLHYFYVSLLVVVLQWLLAPLAMGVSMVGKSYIPSMVLGIALVVCSAMVINSDKYNCFFPYSAIPNLAFNWMGQPLTHQHFIIAFCSIITTFVISLIFCIIYYSRSSVQNG
jgi:hypothetical protein